MTDSDRLALFAAHALTGILANNQLSDNCERTAKLAFSYANSMMVELKKAQKDQS